MQLLRDLHVYLLRLKELREQAELGPRKLRVQQLKIDQHQKQVQDALDAVKHLKVTLHEKEVTLKSSQQKMDRHRQQLEQITAKKEYDALQHEIDHDKQTCRVLEEEILETMSALEEQQKQVPELEKGLQGARAGFGTVEQELASKRSDLDRRITEAQETVRAAEAALPAEVKTVYARQAQARGHDALSPVNNRHCVACYIELTQQSLNELRSGRVVTCKNCGRLMYLPG
jgi:predicted  nucleic acid-binding Zn-ribbon protein